MYHVFKRGVLGLALVMLLTLGIWGCTTYPKKSLLEYDYPYQAYHNPCPPHGYPCGPYYGPSSVYSYPPYTPYYNPYYYLY